MKANIGILTRVTVVAFALFIGLGCSKGGGGGGGGGGDKGGDTPIVHDDDKPGPIPVANPKALVSADLKLMNSLPDASMRNFDSINSGLVTQIFGGTGGLALKTYFDSRIHFFLTPTEIERIQIFPGNFKYTDWTNASAGEGDGVMVGAANLGMSVWLQGAIDSVHYSLKWDGHTHSVDSSRFGLMMIGEGYFEEFNLGPGKGRIKVPPAYRQSILLHEARHSDCTGGIGQPDLDVFRTSKSIKETDRRMTARQCGHLHKLCPATHELAGEPACDATPWGAYAVQDIFLSAFINNLTGRDRAIIDSMQIDTRSRLLYSVTDLHSGRLGWPDMNSEGVH